MILSDENKLQTKYIHECMFTEKLSQSYYRVGRSMPCLCLSESILGAWTTIGVHFPLRRDCQTKKKLSLNNNICLQKSLSFYSCEI